VLDESDIRRLLAETLTADVETIFSDKTGLVCADTASARSLTVGSGPRVPDGFVRHVGSTFLT